MSQITVLHDPEGIKGLAVITPTIHWDARGSFIETWNQRDMAAEGLDVGFVQDNQSISCRGVLRGLHYQKQYPQCKLVRVISGAVYDVAVDLRRSSATYGKHYGILLDDVANRQLYVPQGFAHGYLVLSERAIFSYKVTDFWHPNDEDGLAWDDKDIGVDWPLDRLDGIEILLSEKDKLNPTLKALEDQGLGFDASVSEIL